MRKILSLVMVLGLVAAACNSSTSETTTTLADGSTTEGPAETTTSAAAAVTTTEARATTTAAPTGSGGPSCLVGTWILDSEAFLESMADLFAGSELGSAEVSDLGGTFSTELNADGTAQAMRDGWGFTVATSDGVVTIEINGEETGTWSADDSSLTLEMTDSTLSVESRVEVDGQVINLPNSPVEVPNTIATASDYTCDDDMLTVTNDGITSVMTRG